MKLDYAVYECHVYGSHSWTTTDNKIIPASPLYHLPLYPMNMLVSLLVRHCFTDASEIDDADWPLFED